jgi:hypothetical protein
VAAVAAVVVAVTAAADPIAISQSGSDGWQRWDSVKQRPAFIYTPMGNSSTNTGMDTRRRNFERVLSREPFTGLRAILDSLSPDRETICEAVSGANSYEELMAKLGYRITLTRQIHVQDAFSRLGPAGGVKAVLPYYDIPTQRSLPTLVHFDSTVTTTAESAGFFDRMLAALRTQSSAENQKPV